MDGAASRKATWGDASHRIERGTGMLRNRIRVAAALTAVVAFMGGARAADKVRLTNGQTLTGQVLQDNAEGVKVKRGGEVEYTRDQVASVEYDGTPPAYDAAMVFIRSGDYDRAIEELERALKANHPKLLTQYILYHVATCYQKSINDPKAAIVAFEEIFRQGSESRFLYDAVESLIGLYGDAGRIADARAMLKQLPATRTRVEKVNRLLLEAVIEEKDGKFRQALQRYKRATGDAGATQQEVAAKASVGMARCTLAMKKYEQTRKDLTSLIGTRDLGDLYPQAHLILGDAIVATAKSDGDYEQAILAYLRVPALYAGDEATEAKALFEAARAYQRIKGNEDAKGRAAKLFRMLRDRYPNSSYAEKSPR
jgi:tetratricopeptide (TPR) repeat protein